MTLTLGNQPRNIVISGSSITDDKPWATWATWISRRYGSSNIINTSTKGIGNEVILLKAVQEAKKQPNPLVIVQLTSVDKWDWFVEQQELVNKFINEKHPLLRLQPNDTAGFWSTGSHFPSWKQHWREHYFSLSYQMYHTLQLLNWFQLTCDQQGWDKYVIFDSPILAVTEEELNQGKLERSQCFETKLVKNSLCKVIFDLIDLDRVYQPGLIGYAKLNSHPWLTVLAKSHPGSLVHWLFARDIICPILDQIVEPTVELEEFFLEAKMMQKLFDKC